MLSSLAPHCPHTCRQQFTLPAPAVNEQIDKAEEAWESFHRSAIEKTVRHGNHKAFPNMVLNADQAASTGWRVGQKQAVGLYGGGKDKSGHGHRRSL